MLARHLVDSASARLASQAAHAGEGLHSYWLVAGGTIDAVHPDRFAILIRRAIRVSLTKELATAPRAAIY